VRSSRSVRSGRPPPSSRGSRSMPNALRNAPSLEAWKSQRWCLLAAVLVHHRSCQGPQIVGHHGAMVLAQDGTTTVSRDCCGAGGDSVGLRVRHTMWTHQHYKHALIHIGRDGVARASLSQSLDRLVRRQGLEPRSRELGGPAGAVVKRHSPRSGGCPHLAQLDRSRVGCCQGCCQRRRAAEPVSARAMRRAAPNNRQSSIAASRPFRP
jgi:hypothetical protein